MSRKATIVETPNLRRVLFFFRTLRASRPGTTKVLLGVHIYNDGDKGFLVSNNTFHSSGMEVARHLDWLLRQRGL